MGYKYAGNIGDISRGSMEHDNIYEINIVKRYGGRVYMKICKGISKRIFMKRIYVCIGVLWYLDVRIWYEEKEVYLRV